MWKAVIADDERVILEGLKKLIDWEKLGIEVAGTAYDGQQLQKVIEYVEPDIVLADIMMPYMTGLEVLQWYNEHFSRAKFIFASGYEEFSYAKEALGRGAVDYLLKPVTRSDLEGALKKAIRQLEEKNIVEIFREEKNEMQELFRQINDGRDFENNDLYELFQSENWDFDNSFFVGVCAGIRPDIAARMEQEDFGQYNLVRFNVFNHLNRAFSDRKLGFVVRKDEFFISMIGVYPKKDMECYLDKYVKPIRRQVENECSVELCFGVGMPTEDMLQMIDSYKSAREAFELYFFEEQDLIDICEAGRENQVSSDVYQEDVEQAFRSIISHDDSVMDTIGKVMEDIRAIYYGNRKAVSMRVMSFVEDMNLRLERYRLLDNDACEIQKLLEKPVGRSVTFMQLKEIIFHYFEELLRKLRQSDWMKDKVLIEDVKKYIQEHYTENLSINELASVACVSKNYFSAMFKKEAGQNYKAYLTGIRMEKAIELLRETDLKTYEIGEKVGYNNVRRFVDAFKQIYSVSPMEYKKNMKRELI